MPHAVGSLLHVFLWIPPGREDRCSRFDPSSHLGGRSRRQCGHSAFLGGQDQGIQDRPILARSVCVPWCNWEGCMPSGFYSQLHGAQGT